MNILITDDHPMVRNGLALILQQDYPNDEISHAGNGTEAIEILTNKPIDLMLMDIRMPDTNSLELVEKAIQLRADGENPGYLDEPGAYFCPPLPQSRRSGLF